MFPKRRMTDMPDGAAGKRLKLRFDNMISFSSIATDLQIIIAEKMDYFDQREFSLTSKHGNEILKMTKHRAVVKVELIENAVVSYTREPPISIGRNRPMPRILRLTGRETPTPGAWLHISAMHNFNDKGISWNTFRQVPGLPRFRVLDVNVWNIDRSRMHSDILEMSKKAGFVTNKVELKYCGGNKIQAKSFIELAEIFNIGSFESDTAPDPDVFRLPQFQEVHHVAFTVGGIQEDDLLRIKNTSISFRSHVSLSTRNLFLQQWFQKTREIKELCFDSPLRTPLDIGALFRGLPYEETNLLQENQRRFSIDRGDRKLSVTAKGWDLCYLSAQEETL